MKDIVKIFTKKNIEILELISKKSLHIREISRLLGISIGKVHDSVKLFKENMMVSEINEKNKKIVKINRGNELIKRIFNVLEKEDHKEMIGLFENISPLDFRYYGRDKIINQALFPYLSEEGFIRYLLEVEVALVKVLAKRGICSKAVAEEVTNAAKQVTAEEVYKEEDRIKHNIRALANCIRNKVSEKSKPFVHFTTTSHDIICSADALRYKKFSQDVLAPKLIELEITLINLAIKEKDTIQIGRTHGQHAEPITFGFTIADYIDRLGSRIIEIRQKSNNLRGKIAGAVGCYNASYLFFDDPEKFEEEVLGELGIKPSPISTQIVEAEFMTDFVHSIISCFGVLANIADDMRHLQRSEISEVGEFFESKQVGSSTMPQKRNPINFENVKSMWKEFMPRMMTVYSDQISEHQRDLTNSASSRFIPEILAGFYVSIDRLNRTMSKIAVDKENLKKNFEKNKSMIVAEPLYILLAAYSHPDAHEIVRELTLKSQIEKKPLIEFVMKDIGLSKYFKRFTKRQMAILKNPEKYTGIASKKTEKICDYWKKRLNI